MGKRKKSGMSFNAQQIIQAKGWNVSVFNSGLHMRINGVVDVWPTRRRWMPTIHGPNEYAETYRDLAHLRTIVKAHEELKQTKQQRAAKWFAGLPDGESDNRLPVNGVQNWDEFSRRFGNQPELVAPVASTQRLFEPREPVKLKPLRPSSDDGVSPWE